MSASPYAYLDLSGAALLRQSALEGIRVLSTDGALVLIRPDSTFVALVAARGRDFAWGIPGVTDWKTEPSAVDALDLAIKTLRLMPADEASEKTP